MCRTTEETVHCLRGLNSGSHLFKEFWAWRFVMGSWVFLLGEWRPHRAIFFFRLFIGDEKTRLILKSR